ncbi:LysR substrate-binding domain-containing protein [Leeia oryzae]|uniref:LysR substrate-binding domain-containing protein n=1 Tax=Leeia oryzae TaxID=356662 RepID=UPI0003777CAB|nr:LysR substrate-binding domain-containing protein [Leeia oryzae]
MKPSLHTKGYRRLLPSLTALVEFEAAARLSSFTKAGHELGVTQSAVSRQIKTLEEQLGVDLFHRKYRSIQLTEAGKELNKVVTSALQKIAGFFDKLALEPDEGEVVLGTTAAFSHFHLLPRLSQLKNEHPEINLRLATQMFTSELHPDDVNLFVRYGDGVWPDGKSFFLFDEEVFPVCSPSWLNNHPHITSLEQLSKSALIEYDSTLEGWLGWHQWFELNHFQAPKLRYSLRCSLYTDAIQAALHGQGVVLGWGRLLEDFLSTGKLVRVTPHTAKMDESYYLVLPNGQQITQAVHDVMSWLKNE